MFHLPIYRIVECLNTDKSRDNRPISLFSSANLSHCRMLKYSYVGSAPERLFVTTYGTSVRRKRVNPLSPGGTHMVRKKPISLSTPGLQGLIQGLLSYTRFGLHGFGYTYL